LKYNIKICRHKKENINHTSVMGCLKKMASTCEKNVQIKLTPKNILLIIFNVVYIEVNKTRKKL
jgi:hypothetical protein